MAYCNDKWLMVQSDGTPGNVFTPNMNDTPFPPGGSCDGSTCRTGMDTLDTSKSDTIYFPLNVEDLSTSTATNNIGVFDCGANGGSGTPATDASGSTCQNPLTHLYDPSTSTSFGIPADAGIGMGVNGQSIFPVCESPQTLSHRRGAPPIADTYSVQRMQTTTTLGTRQTSARWTAARSTSAGAAGSPTSTGTLSATRTQAPPARTSACTARVTTQAGLPATRRSSASPSTAI